MKKIIHCCWFGGNKKTKLIKNCMATWSKHMPDYEIIEWNEQNFDINANTYVKEAYENKKWAFVSDYVRLWALYQYGGIYLDTDVELFKPLNEFSEHGFFTGFEKYQGRISPVTAVMGSKPQHPWLKNMLFDYDKITFINEDKTFNTTTNTVRITEDLIKVYGVDKNRDVYQKLDDDIHIYPSSYFCSDDKKSYALHHFDGSWQSNEIKIKKKILKFLKYFQR
ncbi:hypothetical protein KW487_17690 [Vibrio fluvialis]|nr:hypothetical protein [Vibrio fluvialis]